MGRVQVLLGTVLIISSLLWCGFVVLVSFSSPWSSFLSVFGSVGVVGRVCKCKLVILVVFQSKNISTPVFRHCLCPCFSIGGLLA